MVRANNAERVALPMYNRQMTINAVLSTLKVVVSGVVFLVLYRFLIHSIGIEQLGVWSIVLATTSMAGLANLGLSGSVVKFVAKYLAKREERLVCGVIETSALTMGVFFGLVLFVANYFAGWLLSLVVPAGSLKAALSILPFSLIALWLTLTGSTFLAGLDGCQRIDLRNLLLMGGDLVYLFLCLLLVPGYGLIGLAYSQVAQTIILLVAGWFVLKRYIRLLPLIPYRWNPELFKEMISYGLNLQMISFSQMLFDPITKALLTNFGGLAMTGLYEMASKMILAMRGLLVSATQVVVPVVAVLQEENRDMIRKLYLDCYRLFSYIAAPLFAAVIAFAPVISNILIGQYESIFVLFVVLLSVGWFLNSLASPAYFVDVGVGELRWSTISHVVIAVSNLGLGFLFGTLYGGEGVVVGWVLSLITGSFMIVISHHMRQNIALRELFGTGDFALGLASFIGAVISLLFYFRFEGRLSAVAMSVLVASAYSVVLVVPLYRHPMLKRLVGWANSQFLKTQPIREAREVTL